MFMFFILISMRHLYEIIASQHALKEQFTKLLDRLQNVSGRCDQLEQDVRADIDQVRGKLGALCEEVILIRVLM